MQKNKEIALDDEIITSIYLNPLTDFGFKKIFFNKDLLIAFLNDVVGVHIKDIQYQPTEGLGERPEYRRVIFDLFCTTKSDEFFIVEMQLGRQTHFIDRALFYASHAIRKQAPRRKHWNYELKAVYVVSILDFIAFKEKTVKDEVIENVYLYREKAQTVYSEKLKFVFIELPKFKKKAEELKTNTDKWLYLLRHLATIEEIPATITGKIFKRFLKIATIKNLTPKEMKTYHKDLLKDFGVQDVVSCAVQERDFQYVIKLLKRNMTILEVAELTELTPKQIQELISNESLN